MQNISYSVLNTIAAADVTLAGRKLNVAITSSTGSGTFPTLDYLNIESEVSIASAAEVLRVQTITFAAANSTTYKFAITQLINGVTQTVYITYTSDASATAAEIAGAIVAQVNAQTQLGLTASGAGSPITFTAKTGTPIFSLTAISNVVVVAAAPAGTIAQGQGADLVAEGIVGALSGSTYKQYVFSYSLNGGVQMGATTLAGGNQHTLYVDETAANFAAFDTKMTELLNAYVPATTDANPEAVAII